MTDVEIFDRLKSIIVVELGIKEPLTLQTALIGEGLLDSLDFANYLTSVELEFNINIANEDVETYRLGVIDNMLQYLQNKCS